MDFANVKAILARGAELCERTQRRIVELQNEPDQTKRLRLFPTSEAAEILGVSDTHLRALVRDRGDFPKGQVIGGNNHRASHLDEIHTMLRVLRSETNDVRSRRGREGDEPAQV